MKKVSIKELKSIQESAVEVTLDPATAHANLVLSQDGKEASHGNAKRPGAPDDPKRFSHYVNVLGKQGFSAKFYFEVRVTGKTRWNVGVARANANRGDEVPLNPQNGFWAVTLRDGPVYTAAASPPVRIRVKQAVERLGVAVDYDLGVVSFYDVTNRLLLHEFKQCVFKYQPLHPYLCPCVNDQGKNSAPLVLTAPDIASD